MNSIEKDIEQNRERLDTGKKQLDRFASTLRQHAADAQRRDDERDSSDRKKKRKASETKAVTD